MNRLRAEAGWLRAALLHAVAASAAVVSGCSRDLVTRGDIIGAWEGAARQSFYVESTADTTITFYGDGALAITNLPGEFVDDTFDRDVIGRLHAGSGRWTMDTTRKAQFVMVTIDVLDGQPVSKSIPLRCSSVWGKMALCNQIGDPDGGPFMLRRSDRRW